MRVRFGWGGGGVEGNHSSLVHSNFQHTRQMLVVVVLARIIDDGSGGSGSFANTTNDAGE